MSHGLSLLLVMVNELGHSANKIAYQTRNIIQDHHTANQTPFAQHVHAVCECQKTKLWQHHGQAARVRFLVDHRAPQNRFPLDMGNIAMAGGNGRPTVGCEKVKGSRYPPHLFHRIGWFLEQENILGLLGKQTFSPSSWCCQIGHCGCQPAPSLLSGIRCLHMSATNCGLLALANCSAMLGQR